jgi:hypothetical protein
MPQQLQGTSREGWSAMEGSEACVNTGFAELTGDDQAPLGRVSRMLWVSVGFTALALGAIGAVLPLLPTTPFVLLAAFAFGKGSPRLRHWLVSDRRFGPAIQDWETHGAIARPFKFLACAMMAATLTGSVLAGLAPWALAAQALCMMTAAGYILSRPDGPRGSGIRAPGETLNLQPSP